MECNLPMIGHEWKILMVDREKDVHEVTRLALQNSTFDEKSISFLSSYSISQSKQMLNIHDDFALVLLEVEMEADNDGLRLVRYLRETCENTGVPIIFRTSSPEIPDNDFRQKYDIKGCWDKIDLTADKLHALVISGLRSYKNCSTIMND